MQLEIIKFIQSITSPFWDAFFQMVTIKWTLCQGHFKKRDLNKIPSCHEYDVRVFSICL